MLAVVYAGLSNGAVQGWLVKFTPDGCVDTLLCNTVPAWEAEELSLREPPARVYPNPTTGRFFVELPEGLAPVHLVLAAFDGRTVLDQRMLRSEWVDVTALPSGMYICRVEDAAGVRFVTKLALIR
jgi:hypothetical protein